MNIINAHFISKCVKCAERDCFIMAGGKIFFFFSTRALITSSTLQLVDCFIDFI